MTNFRQKKAQRKGCWAII